MVDRDHDVESEMFTLQNEIRVKEQAIQMIDDLFRKSDNERSRYDKLLKEHMKLNESLRDRATEHQYSLQQVKELTEANKKLQEASASTEGRHSQKCFALTSDVRIWKDDSARKQIMNNSLSKQAAEKDDQIAKLTLRVNEELLQLDFSSSLIEELEGEVERLQDLSDHQDSKTPISPASTEKVAPVQAETMDQMSKGDGVSVPRLQRMVPYDPEEKGSKGLLQFLKILGSKEQDVLDTVLRRVESLQRTVATKQRDISSFIPTISQVATDIRLSADHRERLNMLLRSMSLTKLKSESFRLDADIQNLILGFYKHREMLQRRSGVEVFPNCSDKIARKRKRTFDSSS
jgi:hypothetical protein